MNVFAKSGGRLDELKKVNRGAVLTALRRHPAESRTGLIGHTGLSAATVSAITGEFLAENVLLQENAPVAAEGKRGRPARLLAFNPGTALIAVASVKFGQVSAALVDYAGATAISGSREITPTEPDIGAITDILVALFEELIAGGAGRRRLRAINIAVQGVTDIAETTMIWSPMTHRRNLPIMRALKSRFGVPVRVGHDCNRMVDALRFSAGDSLGNHFAAVLLSHGIGMGLLLNGAPLQGERTSAMEFGHLVVEAGGALCRCGLRGCIEAYAGDYAIHRAASGRPRHAPPVDRVSAADIAAIAKAARAGDKNALAACAQAGRALGAGIANMFALMDPFPVAFVGIGTALIEFMRPHILEAIAERTLYPELPAPEFHLFPDETEIILRGCAMNALAEIDRQVAEA